MSNPERGAGRYALIDALRAIACLAVVFYHAKEGNHITGLLDAMPSWFGTLLGHGDAGVAIFFVISGFVIANAMFRDEVDGSYVGRFLLRRSLRLDPPYWAAIALAIAGAYLSARVVPGKVFEPPSVGNLLLHVTYLVDLAGQPRISPVYWTLCLEIQFYLSFALLMWLASSLGRRIGVVRARDYVLAGCAVVAALWTTPWAPFHVRGLFLDNWHLFIAGVLIRRALDGAPGDRASIACYANLAVLALLQTMFGTAASEFVGLAAALLVILGGQQGWLRTWTGGRLLQWLGLISYSLYLTHGTVTGAMFRIGYKITGRSVATETLWLALVVIACCLFAWAFFLVFERAGLRWSKLVAPRGSGGRAAVSASGAAL
jgi:peptidoglycan/LPS O-acetylase OafA/YrhL